MLFPSGLADGKLLEKTERDGSVTPQVDFSVDLLYAMGNISSTSLNVQWIMGLDFSKADNQTLAELTARYTSEILKPRGWLKGVQLGNEPDLSVCSLLSSCTTADRSIRSSRYNTNGRRPEGWSIENYESELTTALSAVSSAVPALSKDFFLPSVCCNWSPDQIAQTDFLGTFGSQMGALAYQHYPCVS